MTLTRLLTVAGALALLATPAMAAHPDMGGTWTLDAAKSDFGQMPSPTDVVVTVKVDGEDFYVNQTGGGQPDMAFHFSTSGKEVTNELPGAKMTSKHRWDADAVVGEIHIVSDDGTKVTFNDRISYSPDGNVMTLKRNVSSPMGESQMTMVLNKKK